MTPLRALESRAAQESRITQRRRDRSSICTQGAHETAAQARAGAVPAGDRLTLEQLLEGVWEGLCAGGTVRCPVCDGQMQRASGAGGQCRGCGTTLA